MRLLVIVLCYFVGQVAFADSIQSQLQRLRVVTEAYPPLNYLENGQLKGASYELLVLVYQYLGAELPQIEVLPWARAYKVAQSDEPVLLFTMSRNAARETRFQWAGKTHSSRIYLVTPAGSGMTEYDPKTTHTQPIVAVMADISQYAVEELDYPEDKIDLVDSNQTLFRIFTKQHAKLFSAASSPIEAAIAQGVIQRDEIVKLTILRESHGHFAFSLAVDSELVATFQQALDALRPEHEAILRKYGLEL